MLHSFFVSLQANKNILSRFSSETQKFLSTLIIQQCIAKTNYHLKISRNCRISLKNWVPKLTTTIRQKKSYIQYSINKLRQKQMKTPQVPSGVVFAYQYVRLTECTRWMGKRVRTSTWKRKNQQASQLHYSKRKTWPKMILRHKKSRNWHRKKNLQPFLSIGDERLNASLNFLQWLMPRRKRTKKIQKNKKKRQKITTIPKHHAQMKQMLRWMKKILRTRKKRLQRQTQKAHLIKTLVWVTYWNAYKRRWTHTMKTSKNVARPLQKAFGKEILPMVQTLSLCKTYPS